MCAFDVVVVVVAGIAAGFLNVVAGGGSLISIPVLILLGQPSVVANGTNRIGLMVEAAVGIESFRKRGFFDPKLGLLLSVPAVAGAIIGARIALKIPDELFNKILAVVMIVALAAIIKNPGKNPAPVPARMSGLRRVVTVVAFFFVGLYGGFIQAGVGFIIIAVLSTITRLSLVNINSVKLFVVGVYLVPSLIVFVVSGNVNWVLGFVLALGMAIGAWGGSHFAVKKGDRWIKGVVIAAVLAMAAKLYGVF
ncbi:MAG: sulfite exporter TauE/SafE family protein [Candidatus Dadabacteria bacterium]|nr:sulfite exporter TauE/SafE family protein [Candidatus Dadabacteria bacterium]